MAAALALLATLMSLALAARVGRRYARRRQPYQLVWAAALGLFALGVGCQFAAATGWSPALYRLWYLSGAILAAAYLGQGTVYLLARRPIAHALMAALLLASVAAALVVWRAPLDLPAALDGATVSGRGMPPVARRLTPFFNVYGTAALVGGAVSSTWRFLWGGGDGRRALGTALIGVGALISATGGTLTHLGLPAALALSEVASVAVIFAGYSLTTGAGGAVPLAPATLARRRWRVVRIGVGMGAGTLLGAVALLPALPWAMGIVTDARHVYTEAVPTENRGTYLVTERGVMQLYSCYVEPTEFPGDAPTLEAASVRAVAVVQKQFDDRDKYRLYNATTHTWVAWRAAA